MVAVFMEEKREVGEMKRYNLAKHEFRGDRFGFDEDKQLVEDPKGELVRWEDLCLLCKGIEAHDMKYPKRKNLRSKKYLDFIRSKTCFHCGRPAEPHHVRKYADGGTSLKPSDTYAVPVCRECHGEAQRYELVDPLMLYIQIVRLLTEYMRR